MIKKIFNNEYMFSVVAKVSGIVLSLMYTVFFNRFLGTALRGEAAYINNVVMIFSVVLGFGIYQAYPYYKKNYGDESKNKFISSVFFQFAIYMIVSILLAVIFKHNITYLTITLLVPLSIIVNNLAYFVLIETPKKKNLADILIHVIDVIVTGILFFFVKPNYLWLVFIIAFKDVAWLLICLKNIKFKIKDIKLNFKDLIEFSKFGFVPMLTYLMSTLNYNIDVLMLKGQVAVSEIGIYALGVTIAEKAWLLPNALKDILLSKLSKGKDNSEVAKVIRFALLACLMLIIAIICVGKPAINILYGEEFSGAYDITVILFIGIIGMVFYKMISAYNIVHKKQNVSLLFLSVSVIINIICNLITIPLMGIKGAALSSIVSYTICGIMFLIYFYKKEKTKMRNILFANKEDLKYLKNFMIKK